VFTYQSLSPLAKGLFGGYPYTQAEWAPSVMEKTLRQKAGRHSNAPEAEATRVKGI